MSDERLQQSGIDDALDCWEDMDDDARRWVNNLAGEVDRLRAELRDARAEIERLKDETFPATWDGLIGFLDCQYPSDVFTAASADPGPQIVALTRELAEWWRDAEREKEGWRDGDTQTYRYRANLLEAALVRWRAVIVERDQLRVEVERLRERLAAVEALRDTWAAPTRRRMHAHEWTDLLTAALAAPTGQENNQ